MAAEGMSASLLQFELSSAVEQAVRGAVDAVLREAARLLSARLAAARDAGRAESRRENRSLRERLQASEAELRAVRYYMAAAEKNIRQCLLLDHREAPVGSDGALQRGRALRNASPRSPGAGPGAGPGSKAAPSVGLCLPTVQKDGPRGRARRTVAGTESTNAHVASDTEPVMVEREVEEFYITEDGVAEKNYKASASGVQDFGRVPEEQEVAGSSSKALEDPCDTGKFEFEMAGAPAGNVTELGLIQVMDGNEVKQSAVKIEEDPEPQSSEPQVTDLAAASSSLLTVTATPSQPQISEGEALLGLMPPIEGDVTFPSPAARDSADKVHRCNVCGRGFRRFYCLKTHQRIHTGERPYPCRYCEKRFRHLDSLHKHQRIHTGERPYRCALCGCCFRELGQLKKHRLKHSPSGGAANLANTAPHTTLSLLPTGQSYVWPHLNSQDSV